jgi:hypothetical protein
MGEARRARIVAVVFAAIALAGCGPFGGKSAKDNARDTLQQLVDARNQRDFAKVCGLLSSDLLAKFKQAKTTCEHALTKLTPQDSTTTLRIEQVRVSGDRATIDATVSQNAGAGNAQTILMVKEGSDWKVSKVGF